MLNISIQHSYIVILSSYYIKSITPTKLMILSKVHNKNQQLMKYAEIPLSIKTNTKTLVGFCSKKGPSDFSFSKPRLLGFLYSIVKFFWSKGGEGVKMKKKKEKNIKSRSVTVIK